MAAQDIDTSANEYTPISSKALTMTCEQGKKFEQRQSEPSRQPTPAERAIVQMLRQTVKR